MSHNSEIDRTRGQPWYFPGLITFMLSRSRFETFLLNIAHYASIVASSLLSRQQQEYLHSIVSISTTDRRWMRLYRASIDGFTAAAFHDRVSSRTRWSFERKDVIVVSSATAMPTHSLSLRPNMDTLVVDSTAANGPSSIKLRRPRQISCSCSHRRGMPPPSSSLYRLTPQVRHHVFIYPYTSADLNDALSQLHSRRAGRVLILAVKMPPVQIW